MRGRQAHRRPTHNRAIPILVVGAVATLAVGVLVFALAFRIPQRIASATLPEPVTHRAKAAIASLVGPPRPPESCTDVARRFPEWQHPDSAVSVVVDQIRRDIKFDHRQPFMGSQLTDPYALPGDRVVASWIMASLHHAHYGESVPLQDFEPTLRRVTELHGTWRSYRLGGGNPFRRNVLPEMRPLLAPEQWEHMQAWPADSCDGAFLKDPRNRVLVQLMEASVGDTSWAAPRR